MEATETGLQLHGQPEGNSLATSSMSASGAGRHKLNVLLHGPRCEPGWLWRDAPASASPAISAPALGTHKVLLVP